jgi:hypothetical protein
MTQKWKVVCQDCVNKFVWLTFAVGREWERGNWELAVFLFIIFVPSEIEQRDFSSELVLSCIRLSSLARLHRIFIVLAGQIVAAELE